LAGIEKTMPVNNESKQSLTPLMFAAAQPQPSQDNSIPCLIKHKTGLSRFIMRIFRDRSLYGSLAFAETAESLRLNLDALQVKTGDRVVGVTSSGDLLLSLLSSGPEKIIGFDANPIQTALAHLKLVAITALSVENYLQLMGIYAADPCFRIELFDRVSRLLPPVVVKDLRLSYAQIGRGILNCGMTHLMIGACVSICRRLLGSETMTLLLGTCGTDNDRREALSQLQSRRLMRCIIQPVLACLAPLLKWLLFPHRLCRISRRPDEIIANPLIAFRELLVQGLKENPVLCRSATGHIHPEWRSHFYNDNTFKAIRDHSHRLTLDNADIITGLSRIDTGWATSVYLSNVPDYLSSRDLIILIREMQRVTAPGARVVYYSLYAHDLLKSFGSPLPTPQLQALQDSDTVAIYPLIMVRISTRP
jgi:S-adenosylmethionine:diacylglycerol 3-amino-3-carboxypropyl transferase